VLDFLRDENQTIPHDLRISQNKCQSNYFFNTGGLGFFSGTRPMIVLQNEAACGGASCLTCEYDCTVNICHTMRRSLQYEALFIGGPFSNILFASRFESRLYH
jgi:hypothetical protein